MEELSPGIQKNTMSSTENGNCCARSGISSSSGDFVARNKTIQGDEVHRDKVIGHKIEVQRIEVAQQAPLAPLAATAPPPFHHFTGRRRDLGILKAALTTGEAVAPIALQGMGGIGKTATALQLAAELSPEFPGGIFWGALPDYAGSPRPILRIWARICGEDLADEADLNALAQLMRGLLVHRRNDDGPLLAIIDDIRQEWQDAAQVLIGALPAGTPLLLTTRDETLATALGCTIHHLESLPPEESLTLLKAEAGVAGAAFIETNLAETEASLKALDHLPLAIVLAGRLLAKRFRKPGYNLRMLRQAIEERAAEALELRGHPGLAGTFGVTYEVLPTELRRLFRQLGIFAPSPFEVVSVGSMLGLDEAETEADLDELVSLALLNWGTAEGLYTMHPLLHQYARTLLVKTGEVDEAEQKHLAYYLAFAQANAQEETRAWDRLEEELPNLLLAAERAARTQDTAAMVSLEGTLIHEGKFMNVRGYYREAVELLSQSLVVQKALDEQENQPRTLNKLGFFHRILSEHERAEELLEEALSLAVVLEDREQQADSLHYLAILFDEQGKSELALEHFDEELGIRHDLGNPERLASCLNSLGMVQTVLGDYAEARQRIGEALAIYEDIDDPQGVAMCVANRGIPLLYMGDYANAMNDFQAALDRNRDLKDQEGIAQSLLNMGLVQSYLGDYSSALRSLGESLSLCQRMGHRRGEALNHVALAAIYSALADYQEAERHLQAADKRFHKDDRDVLVQYLNALGAVHYGLGDHIEAVEDYRQMEVLASGYSSAQSKLGLARAHLAQDREKDWENAQRDAMEALRLCQAMQLAGSEPRAHAYLGRANLLLGHKETALHNSREAMRLLKQQKHVDCSEAEIYLIHIQILEDNGLVDERQKYLERACHLVRSTAKKIEDKALQRSYLAAPVSRGILEA